jgi:hypothetical protein
MGRAPSSFRETDVKRAVRAFEKAGKEVVAADITPDCTIRIKLRRGKDAVTDVKDDNDDANPWDAIDLK